MRSAAIKISHALLVAHLSTSHRQHTMTPPSGYPQCHPSELCPAIALCTMPKHTRLRYDACQSSCAFSSCHLDSKLPHGPHAPRAATAPVPQAPCIQDHPLADRLRCPPWPRKLYHADWASLPHSHLIEVLPLVRCNILARFTDVCTVCMRVSCACGEWHSPIDTFSYR
ncbi:hypothetical protein DFH94DRAFT_347042 [Russula ochroleuca]|uniref:Uncharacterized protein n=1 Tax=Russula ochroleuca TaxID=152965 RepID=A0A9P5JV42_9AGAM|nr:hypothetical protein DFH94DRAFT_347042 [Russula ochroleuca]